MKQNQLSGFLIMLAVGSAVYVGFGDYLQAHNEKWIEPELPPDVEFILIRVHLFGLFFACIGIVGVIVWLVKNDLIIDSFVSDGGII